MFCSLFSFVQKLYSNLSNLISYVGQLLPSTLFKYIPTNSLIFVLFDDFKSNNDLDNNNNLVINKCTDNVVSILGYNSHQLIGKVIEAILPPYFQQHHSEYIKNYIATGRNILFSKRKDNLFKLYGYNNSYFIVSIKIIIRQLFETEKFNKMSFISLINYVQDDYGVVLVRSNGKVDSFNEIFSTHIGMNIDDTNENDIYIYHIFMSLLIGYNKVSKFNMKNFYSSNEPEDNLFKLKMCNEKNFKFKK